MRLPRILIATLVVLSLAGQAAPLRAQVSGDVGQMFDSFTISLVAATSCAPPDDATLSNFLGNLMVVQRAILDEYKARYPRADEANLLRIIDERISQLGRSVQDRIASVGCTDESVTTMVQMFRVNARADLFGQQ